MKLWLLTQTERQGYNTYDCCVVAAEHAEAAKQIHPGEYSTQGPWWVETDGKTNWRLRDWAAPSQVTATYLGEAKESLKAGVICASFNAG